MKKKYLLVSLFLLVWIGCSVVALWNLSMRPALPVELEETRDGLFLAAADTSSARQIVFVEETEVNHVYQADDIVGKMQAGDSLTVQTSDGQSLSFTLVKRYQLWSLLLKGLVGLIFFAVSTIVWLNAQDEGERYFAYSGYLFGFTIIAWWSGMKLPLLISIPFIILYFLSYPQAVLCFVYFSYHFPTPALTPDRLRKRKTALQFMGITLSVMLMTLYFAKTYDLTLDTMRAYHVAYRLFRLLIIVAMGFAVFNMFKNEVRASNPVSQRKLQWVIGGAVWGIFPFLFFWNLPHLLGLSPVLPEWLFDFFFVISPICTAIAILKYRLFDIEIVLSRSLAYGVIISILIGVYVLIVGGMSRLIYQQFSLESPYLSIISVVVIALVFNPLKRQVQRFIDQKFFRIRYHQFQSMQKFLTGLEACSDQQQILGALQDNFHTSIPVKKQTFMEKRDDKWRVIAGNRDNEFELHDFLQLREPLQELTLTVNETQTKKIERRLEIEKAELPGSWIVMLPLSETVVWLLAEKQSGRRYWQEDLELARQMARAAKLQWEKLRYVQLAVRESLEKEQAQKLSQWKSMLVAEVAHDLRAPLNTMLWKLKNLQTELIENPTPDTASLEELQQQILRLQGFVQNMLRLSRMEHGELHVQVSPCRVRQTLETVVQDLQKLISSKQLQVNIDCPAELQVQADPVMLQEVLLNLIDNAAKFSRKSGAITLKANNGAAGSGNGMVEILIQDEGRGISPQIMRTLFEPFKEDSQEKEKGFHLGMYISREFTLMMQGKLDLESKEGKGTTVRLSFSGPGETGSRKADGGKKRLEIRD